MRSEPSVVATNVGAKTDIGRIRDHNEDALLALPKRGLFMVSDGMGGHNAGELASKVVVEVLPALVEQRLAGMPPDQTRQIAHALREAILELTRTLRGQAADRPELAGMGATVVLALIRDGRAFIAHMGDSRAYRFRRGKLRQLTNDHSIVGILLRAGEISPEEAKHHPARGRLSRYVGMNGEVYPDVRSFKLARGDRLLLCTDGLTGMVSDDAIAAILAGAADPQMGCGQLVEAANAAGGTDNITAVIVDSQALSGKTGHKT